MKYISFSFDDGRSDTYHVAMPIMERCGIKATMNVVTKFIKAPESFSFNSCIGAVSQNELIDWKARGNEIALHGATHKNTVEDIKDNINDLSSMGVEVSSIGFSSPKSELTLETSKSTGIYDLYKNGVLGYIRSGVQVRRMGKVYILGSLIEKYTHSSLLYYFLNKDNVIRKATTDCSLLPSVAVKSYNSMNQLLNLVEKMDDETGIIFMFHSILHKENVKSKKSIYFWDAEMFEKFCHQLSQQCNVSIVTTKELVEILLHSEG